MGDILKFEQRRDCQLVTIRGNGHSETLALDTEFVMDTRNDEIHRALKIAAIENGLEIDYYLISNIFPSNKEYFYIDSMQSLSDYLY
jgi:hypothetical protein